MKLNNIIMAKEKIDPCIYNEVIVTEDFTRAIVQNDKFLFGLIELPSTNELTPFKYINMSEFSSGRSVVYVDGKYGAIDLDGKEIIPPVYEVMESFYNDRAVAKRDGKVGIIDVQGNVIADFIYDELPYQIDYGVFPMVKDGFHGVIDMDGKEIVPFIYDWCRMELGVGEYYILASKGEEETIYDMKGNKLLSCKYKHVEYKKDYVIASEDGYKYGVLDLQGRVLIPFEYSKYNRLDKERGVFAMESPNDYSIYGKMVTTTFFDLDGNKLMHIPYSVILKDDGIYVYDGSKYGKEGKIGLYDYNGKILIPPINEILRHLEDKRYLVQERGQDVAYVLDLVTGKTTELPYKLIESVLVEPDAADWFNIVTSKGKYGIVNRKLEVVVPIIYDKIGYIRNNKYFEVTLDGKMGVLDTKGNLIIPFEYEKIDCLNKIEYAHIKSKRKFGYYNIETGTEMFFTFADNYPNVYPEKGFVVRKKNKYGLLDWAGNALGLPPETCEQKPKKKKIPTPICPFTAVRNFCEGFAAVQIGDKWGYIDTQGNLIHPITLEEACDFENGHARVYGGKGLYINTKGEYDGYIDCGRFDYSRNRTPRGEHGYIYSKKEGNKVGWVNYAGKEIIPCIYDSDNRYGPISLEDKNQYIIVCLNNKYGIFNLRGKVILELEHDEVFERGGLWMSIINNKEALFAEDGRRLTPHKYDKLSDFKGNILKSEVDGKYGFINKEGQEVVPTIYDDVKISSQGNYVILSLKENSCMVNSDGKEICQLKYDTIDSVNEEIGLAKVYRNNYYGFIDTKGNEVIPLKYCYAWEFINGYAEVKVSGQHGLINAKGEEVVPLQYNYVGDYSIYSCVNFDLGIISIGDGKRFGIYDLFNRKELIAPKYSSCGKYSDGWLAVKSRGKWGFVDLEGNPLDYEWLKAKTK